MLPDIEKPISGMDHVSKEIELTHYTGYVYKRVTQGPIHFAGDMVKMRLPPVVAMLVYEELNRCFNLAVKQGHATTLYVRNGSVAQQVYPVVVHCHINYSIVGGLKTVDVEWYMVSGGQGYDVVLDAVEPELRAWLKEHPLEPHWSKAPKGDIHYVI